MIEMRMIPAFFSGEVAVATLWVLISSSSALIVCPSTGTTLGIDMQSVDDLLQNNLSEDFLFLLIQRGMAKCEGSRAVSKVQDQINPNFFLIDLTKGCNLKCTYCFRELDRNTPKMEDTRLAEICGALIAYSRKNPNQHMTIQAWGGEPLLELSKVLEIRKRFDDEGLNPQIEIETNATLITEDVARKLFESRINVGVSIDGPSCVHNNQRPFLNLSPSLDAVEKGILNLRRAGYQSFGSITVVTQATYDHLKEVIEYLSVNLQLHTIKLNLMRQTVNNLDLALPLDAIDSYVEKLIDCMRNCMNKGVHLREQNISQRIANLVYRPCDNICNAHGCHGGYRMLSIDANGDVFPCELTDDQNYNLGNISDDSFDALVFRAIENNHAYFRKRNMDACLNCPWFFYCRGGCKAAAKYHYGDPSKIDQTECIFNQKLYPKLADILLNEPKFGKYLLGGVTQ